MKLIILLVTDLLVCRFICVCCQNEQYYTVFVSIRYICFRTIFYLQGYDTNVGDKGTQLSGGQETEGSNSKSISQKP